ncbi:MAG: hypothetical protein LIO62_08930 [Clostridiales bacterium]|nr:hypothetical protein [Clostridiales bacterium]
MGTYLKGGATYYRSIGQNVLITSKSYKYSNGYFGDNSRHGNIHTRNIVSENALSSANDFYNKLAYGGTEQIINNNLSITRMADGTVITKRIISHSDGSPVVDINIKGSNHSGGIKQQKIHFIGG